MIWTMLLIPIAAITQLNPTLPDQARVLLDRSFPGWELIKYAGVPDSLNLDSLYEYSNFYQCDLNGDAIPDYALAIMTHSDTLTLEYFVALVSSEKAYSLFTLVQSTVDDSKRGQFAWSIEHKGSQVTNSDPSNFATITLKTDAIVYLPLTQCCPRTFVFSDGKFKVFLSGD